MTLNEFISNNKLWLSINSVNEFQFITDSTPEMMDFITTSNYGERTLLPIFETADLSLIAKSIVLTHGSKWSAMLGINLSDYDIGADSIRETETTINKSESKTNTSSTTNKISAYNESVLLDDGGSEGTGSDTNTSSDTVILKDVNKNLNTAYKNLYLTVKNNIITESICDVVKTLTSPIY